MGNALKLLSWNVNGVRAVHKKGELEKLIKSEDPDILCIQETKAQPEQVPQELKELEGYQSYFCSAEKKGYSGVGVWTKEKPLEVINGFGKKKYDSEGRTIILKFKKFTLLNVYFPNGKRDNERLDYKMGFYKEFLKYCKKLEENGEKVIFCGDVNTAHTEIDLARPKGNINSSGFLEVERRWIDDVISKGYRDTFRDFNEKGENYTWWDVITKARDRNVGWRIDYFFISDNLKKNLKDAFILKDVMGSDHCPIGIDIQF